MKKEIIKTFLGVMICFETSIAQIPMNGLAAYYNFTGNANDNSGNGHNGSVNGATLTTDRFGNSNCAYLYDGINDYISLGTYSNIIPSGNDFTMGVWIQANQVKNQTILMINPDDFNDRLNASVYYLHSGVPWTFWDYGNAASGGRLQIQGTIYSPNWEHYIFIVNSSQNYMEVYKNGILQLNSATSSLLVNRNRELRVGGAIDASTAPFFFDGKIDEMAIYNRVLTATEIQQLYIAGCVTPNSTITAFGNTNFCSGSNVLLVATPGKTGYQWKKNNVNISGATGASYTASATGSYKCVTSCGASTATSNTIALTKLTNASVTVSATGSTTFCAGSSATLNSTNPGAGYTYQWYRNNISINGATGLSYDAYNPGSYKIITTFTATGCSRISNAVTITVNCRIGNPELISGSIEHDNRLNVYPNPAFGSFTIELNDEENIKGTGKIEMFNMSGQQVYQSTEQIEKGQWEKEINFGSNYMINGPYILRLITNDKVYESKVIIN
ncbi:MAG TPA: LamG-like jellyroll fold domain-containing protein [Bacteroidia bacterium]|nr:LamG-like jellyroll fold domain-containing protein [Bacteroidia bacterium]